jgi:hypothetical protein
MRGAVLLLLLSVGCGRMGLEYAEENAADLAMEPATGWDFGELLPEHQAAVHNFSITPDDDERGTFVEDVWLDGDTGAFAIARAPDLPVVIESGRHETVVVRFRPEKGGAFRAELKAIDGNGARYRRTLVGTGCRNRDGDRRCDR